MYPLIADKAQFVSTSDVKRSQNLDAEAGATRPRPRPRPRPISGIWDQGWGQK